MKKTIFALSLLGTLSLFSCNKVSKPTQKSPLVSNSEISQEWIDEYVKNPEEELADFNEFKSNCDSFDMKHLKDVSKLLTVSQSKALSIWGIGTGNKVWKWNGASWFEPNPAATLKFVNPSCYGGAVWGIGTDNKVWKWNGASWFQPNAAASLYYICSYSSDVAMGMGYGGTLFITYNGGLNWSYFTSINNVMSMSVGNFTSNTIWVTQLFSGTYRLLRFDYTGSTWVIEPTPVTPRQVSAMWAEGAWFLQNGSYNIYRKLSNSSGSFTQPNPSAGLLQLSSNGLTPDVAWGVSSDNSIWKWNGASWGQQNPASRLLNVCTGYE